MVGNRYEEVTDNCCKRTVTIVVNHQCLDTSIERELKHNASCAACCITNSVHVTDRGSVEQDTKNQEQEVNSIKIQTVQALRCKVSYKINDTCDSDDVGKNRAVLNLLSRSNRCRILSLIVLQKSRIYNDRVFRSRMHLAKCDCQNDDNDKDRDQVPRCKDGLCCRDTFCNNTTGIGDSLYNSTVSLGVVLQVAGCVQGQRDRTRNACMPDNEHGVTSCDNQTIVNALDSLCNFLTKESTNDKTEAPVNECSDSSYNSNDHDALNRSLSHAGQLLKDLLDRGSCSKCSTGNNDQCHLHSECEQGPYAAAPCVNEFQWAGLSSRDRCDKYNDGKHRTEDERIRQILVHQLYEKVTECLHNMSSLCCDT